MSKILSIFNAFVLANVSGGLLYLERTGNFTNFFYEPKPWHLFLINFILKWFRAYLFVDVIFFICAHLQGRMKEKGMILNIIHHLVGLVSMQAFIIADRYYVNSLFYAFTEISTIPLHLAWMFSPQNPELVENDSFSVPMMFFALIAYVLFFIVRILGSLWFWFYYIIPNYNFILNTPLWQRIFLWGGNGILTALNWYWFGKMTYLLYKK